MLIQKFIIRTLDILISIISLIVLIPFLILVSFLILLIDGKPIIFKQIRVGKFGKKFTIFKFRTMDPNIHKNENSRITKLGKILRKSSFDELLQLINVINNDMSIVGPRPLPENIEKKIKSDLKEKRRKVLPGITGLSQINYKGKKRSLISKIKLDIVFVENYSLQTYLKIILKTPSVLIIRLFKNKSSIIK